jgi:integrase
MPKKRKGTVAIAVQKGMLRLRWRHQGTPYTLTLALFDSPLHRRIAEGKAAEIQADIAFDRFDRTLAKYRGEGQAEKRDVRPTLELWQLFTQSRRSLGLISPATESARYKPLAANLRRYAQDLDSTTATGFIDLLRSRQNPRIANQNLSLLKGFGEWCVDVGHWQSNPFKAIAPQKGAEQARQGKPFSKAEIRLFLDTIAQDRHYAHYHDLCLFMFHTGCRPGEALGLRWSQIDLADGTVRIRATKTDSSHTLRLQPVILKMLGDRPRPSDGLVFPGPRGKRISPKNFCQRCWKRTCDRAGIPYRVPYFARHSLASHMIDGGASYPQVAYVLGHKTTRMVQQTYGRMIEAPDLPEF